MWEWCRMRMLSGRRRRRFCVGVIQSNRRFFFACNLRTFFSVLPLVAVRFACHRIRLLLFLRFFLSSSFSSRYNGGPIPISTNNNNHIMNWTTEVIWQFGNLLRPEWMEAKFEYSFASKRFIFSSLFFFCSLRHWIWFVFGFNQNFDRFDNSLTSFNSKSRIRIICIIWINFNHSTQSQSHFRHSFG